MTRWNSVKLAASIKNGLSGSRIVRVFPVACATWSGLLIAACMVASPVEAVSEPDPDLVFVRGYRSGDDTCMLTGENAFTIDFLDDAADLVTCPTGHVDAASLMATTNATVVTQTTSFTLFSVPRR